jgi:hypothetical protein
MVYALTLVAPALPSGDPFASGDFSAWVGWVGWSDWPVWALLAAGIVVLAVFGFYALRASRSFDYVGLGLSTVGIVGIVYALTVVTQTNPATVTATNPAGDLYGWGFGLVWALMGAGALMLALFAAYALWVSRDPALDLRQFKRRDFLVSNLFSWVTAPMTFGLLVLLPLYFESVRQPRLSALDTGLALVPLGLGTLVGTIFSAVLYRTLGPRWVVMLGAALIAVSAWLLAQTIIPTADAGQLLAAARSQSALPAVVGAGALRWPLFILGLSVTFVAIPVQTLALEALKGEALAKASSLVISSKFLFSSVGVAVITTILVERTRARATDLATQIQALGVGSGTNPGGTPSDPRVAAAMRALQAQIGVQAGTWAIQSIFWLIFFASLGMIVLALVLPGRRRFIAEATPAEAPQTGSRAEPVLA